MYIILRKLTTSISDVSSIKQKIKHQAFSSKKFDKKIKNEIEGDKKHITNEFFLKDSY